MNFTLRRTELLEWVREQLIGPDHGEEEIKGSPLDRYPTGILFPIVRGQEGVDPASADEEDDEESDLLAENNNSSAKAEPATRQRRYIPPSSVGFSFFVSGEAVRFHVQCSAARYEGTGERDESGQFQHRYKRIELGDDGCAQTFNAPDHRRVDALQDCAGKACAGIDVLWRPHREGWIVTVTLFNKQEMETGAIAKSEERVEHSLSQVKHKSNTQARVENSLFQVKLKCVLEAGEIGAYPRVDKSLLSAEEQELELQYRERHIYAVGHGAAVNWAVGQAEISELWTEFMPAVEVPQLTADVAGGESRVLELAHLAASNRPSDVFADLDRFVGGYAEWVESQKTQAAAVDSDEHEAAERITGRMQVALRRMRRGVVLLRSDPKAAESFRLANRAMLDQMRQTDIVRKRSRAETNYRWRPFQLAFLLTVMESAIQEDDDFRDVVDLIWFPTGGGKTEAYLGLIAFVIVWRRLSSPPSGGGTTVLMRYTLRLLTAQQYLRATRMICALELIRRQEPDLQDGDPITIGMWVGSATSPNRFEDAREHVVRAGAGVASALRSLVLETCPWCGTPFKAPDNYISNQREFHFCCTNPECDFGRHGQGILPCNVVDEALYAEPPTLLIATIDKFARLAWEERANAFFGANGNLPPQLVIQDELHLIAGALGSVAGLYEAALDAVLKKRGPPPKYIASTATIRMAQDQVRRLYGRDLAVFPPPGLSCDDSYFARTVPTEVRPGRMYVGYLAPMLDRQHCMAPLAAALIAAPEVKFVDQEDANDLIEAWWTQVIYHGSLKGVGNSHNAFTNDVRDKLQRFIEEIKQVEAKKNPEESNSTPPTIRSIPQIAQLTSISSAAENALTFSRLEKPHGDPECIDAVLATNMVSVGLDVTRLALMIVNGQPLTTAEYIQASSRVGRGEVPGLVFANYYRDQARSLSHYENFRPYHDAFYRFVEPTSVTPYTYQARTRALHAALVIAIRHAGADLLGNNQAGQFKPDNDYVKKVIEVLTQRCADADAERAKETAAHIGRLVEQWRNEVERCRMEKMQLNYESRDNNADRLLYNHDDIVKGLWPTLQSMRNVENTALLKPL